MRKKGIKKCSSSEEEKDKSLSPTTADVSDGEKNKSVTTEEGILLDLLCKSLVLIFGLMAFLRTIFGSYATEEAHCAAIMLMCSGYSITQIIDSINGMNKFDKNIYSIWIYRLHALSLVCGIATYIVAGTAPACFVAAHTCNLLVCVHYTKLAFIIVSIIIHLSKNHK